MAPLVTVIMAVHDGLPYVGEAVESVLAQDFDDFEFLAIDDGSADGSREVLERAAARDGRVRVLVNEGNIGLTRSLNRGLAEARGELIARMDADDVCLPQRLGRQVEAFGADPKLAVLGSAIVVMDESGRELRVDPQPRDHEVIRRKLLFENSFIHPSVMFRKAVLDEHGLGYDEGMRYGQDYRLWSQFTRVGKGANLGEPLLKFRNHPGQISKRRVEEQQALADEVAWENFVHFGLEGEFVKQEVCLMRRLGLRGGGLSRRERAEQWWLWKHLFRVLDEGLVPNDPDWRATKRLKLYLLRRELASFPVLMSGIIDAVLYDPADAWSDLAGVLKRRLGRS